MPSKDSFPIRSKHARWAAFDIQQKPTGECVVRWQYPGRSRIGAIAVLLTVVLVIFLFFWYELDYPNAPGKLVLIFGFILLVVFAVGVTMIVRDDRSEGLVLRADRLEHLPPSSTTHSLFSMTQRLYPGAEHHQTDDFSEVVPMAEPVLFRAEVTRLEFNAYGEGPVCLLRSAKRGLFIGLYLHPSELRLIALAIQSWMRGEQIEQVGSQLRHRLQALLAADLTAGRTVKMELWEKLIRKRPKDWQIVDPEFGFEDEVIVALRGIASAPRGRVDGYLGTFLVLGIAGIVWLSKAFDQQPPPDAWIIGYAAVMAVVVVIMILDLRSTSTMLRFKSNEVVLEQTFLRLKRRSTVPYDQIEQVRLLYGSRVRIDLQDRSYAQLSVLRAKTATWIAKLMVARSGAPLWRSKASPARIVLPSRDVSKNAPVIEK